MKKNQWYKNPPSKTIHGNSPSLAFSPPTIFVYSSLDPHSPLSLLGLQVPRACKKDNCITSTIGDNSKIANHIIAIIQNCIWIRATIFWSSTLKTTWQKVIFNWSYQRLIFTNESVIDCLASGNQAYFSHLLFWRHIWYRISCTR